VSRRVGAIATALATVAVLVAAGCSSSSKKPDKNGTSKPSAPAGNAIDVNAQPRDKIEDGGTETIGIQQWITQYNP